MLITDVFKSPVAIGLDNSYPSSWAAGRHPVCSDLLVHYTALLGPKPNIKIKNTTACD